jgi:hypothetical protein
MDTNEHGLFEYGMESAEHELAAVCRLASPPGRQRSQGVNLPFSPEVFALFWRR